MFDSVMKLRQYKDYAIDPDHFQEDSVKKPYPSKILSRLFQSCQNIVFDKKSKITRLFFQKLKNIHFQICSNESAKNKSFDPLNHKK